MNDQELEDVLARFALPISIPPELIMSDEEWAAVVEKVGDGGLPSPRSVWGPAAG